MKPEEMTAVQERRFRKSVDYFRKNREIYVRRIKKILEEYKNALAAEKAADEDSDVLLSEAFSLKSLIPDKVYNMSASSTPFSFPPTPSLTEAPALFSPWPMVGIETTPLADPNFSFSLPTTPLSLSGTTPECTTPVGAATFGYNNFGGINAAFYQNVPAFCSCADCLGKSNIDVVNSSSYCGLYPSDDSGSTFQKSGGSSGSSQPKDETNRPVNSGSQYPSTDSNDLDSETQFDLPYFCSTGGNNNNVDNAPVAGCNKESFNITPPSSEKKVREKSGDAGIDSQAKIVQKKSVFQTETRVAFNSGLPNENIDYYASMNSFPNNNSNSVSLFSTYSNRAAIGAGDGASAVAFRNATNEQQSQQSSNSPASSMNLTSSQQDSTSSIHQPQVMMYNNTSSYALPYMSWSQGEPLMIPTVFTAPTPNTNLETAFPTGMQPIQAPPPSGTQTLFPTAGAKERPQGHDEHNPDYANCFPSSNPTVVSNNTTAHEAY
ncbi:uncharacterized protein LOC142340452 isoform X2 [Convolutriloba macropyga]|uniref:uncharacterized protein LOC142340452 isoform X2 n=1 Tax=Convolutriloba macropyga TaxID=536237 RepID=UPI003F51DCBC